LSTFGHSATVTQGILRTALSIKRKMLLKGDKNKKIGKFKMV